MEIGLMAPGEDETTAEAVRLALEWIRAVRAGDRETAAVLQAVLRGMLDGVTADPWPPDSDRVAASVTGAAGMQASATRVPGVTTDPVE